MHFFKSIDLLIERDYQPQRFRDVLVAQLHYRPQHISTDLRTFLNETILIQSAQHAHNQRTD